MKIRTRLLAATFGIVAGITGGFNAMAIDNQCLLSCMNEFQACYSAPGSNKQLCRQTFQNCKNKCRFID